jgi:hypothetical protein
LHNNTPCILRSLSCIARRRHSESRHAHTSYQTSPSHFLIKRQMWWNGTKVKNVSVSCVTWWQPDISAWACGLVLKPWPLGTQERKGAHQTRSSQRLFISLVLTSMYCRYSLNEVNYTTDTLPHCNEIQLYPFPIIKHGSWSSSVSVVSNYELKDSTIGVQSPAQAVDFPSNLCVQTRSVSHPASFPMGTGDHFLREKARSGRDADHSPQSSAEVKNK